VVQVTKVYPKPHRERLSCVKLSTREELFWCDMVKDGYTPCRAALPAARLHARDFSGRCRANEVRLSRSIPLAPRDRPTASLSFLVPLSRSPWRQSALHATKLARPCAANVSRRMEPDVVRRNYLIDEDELEFKALEQVPEHDDADV
jgi:hypothetical protein